MEAARSALIAGIAICGLAAVVLSFLPWVTFETRGPNGTIFGAPQLDGVSESFSGLDIVQAAAIDGSAVWAISRGAPSDDEEAYDYDEDKEPMEGTEAWA